MQRDWNKVIMPVSGLAHYYLYFTLLDCFRSAPTPEGDSYTLAAKCYTMFTTDCVCLPLGAEQVVHSGFLEPFSFFSKNSFLLHSEMTLLEQRERENTVKFQSDS